MAENIKKPNKHYEIKIGTQIPVIDHPCLPWRDKLIGTITQVSGNFIEEVICDSCHKPVSPDLRAINAGL